MKDIKLKQELQKLDAAQLQEKVSQFKRELFNLKLNASTAHVKDYSQYKKLRQSIARASTYLQQKMKEL